MRIDDCKQADMFYWMNRKSSTRVSLAFLALCHKKTHLNDNHQFVDWSPNVSVLYCINETRKNICLMFAILVLLLLSSYFWKKNNPISICRSEKVNVIQVNELEKNDRPSILVGWWLYRTKLINDMSPLHPCPYPSSMYSSLCRVLTARLFCRNES